MFSTIEVVSKLIGDGITPYGVTVWRFLTGGIVLLPFALGDIRKNGLKLGHRQYLGFWIAGLLNVCLSMLFLQLSVYYGKANLSAVIVSSNPVFVMLFAALLLKEQVTSAKLAGIGLGIVGLVLIITGEGKALSSSLNLQAGIMYGLAAALTFGLSTVYSRRLIQQNGNLVTLCFTFIFGAATLFVYSLFQHDRLGFVPSSFNVLWMLYLGLGVTGLAYILYFRAIQSMGAMKASSYFFLKPVIAGLLAWSLRHESFSRYQLLGVALIMLSLLTGVIQNTLIGWQKQRLTQA